MGDNSAGGQILRVYSSGSAPTGESEQYETADGRTWHRLQPGAGPPKTGEIRGVIEGDYIRPYKF